MMSIVAIDMMEMVNPSCEVTDAVPVELSEVLSKCLAGEILPSQVTEEITAYLLRQIRRPATTIIT
jgi:hypothetical protein